MIRLIKGMGLVFCAREESDSGEYFTSQLKMLVGKAIRNWRLLPDYHRLIPLQPKVHAEPGPTFSFNPSVRRTTRVKDPVGTERFDHDNTIKASHLDGSRLDRSGIWYISLLDRIDNRCY